VPPIIVAQGLSKVYRSGRISVPALSDVSFAVERGEYVSIVGPSGSGKSTLFYLLGGLTRATSGTVLIDGVDFASLPDAERTAVRGRKIGFVFQKFNLLPTLSARSNIEIAYEISGRQSGGSSRRWTRNFSCISQNCWALADVWTTARRSSRAASSSVSRLRGL